VSEFAAVRRDFASAIGADLIFLAILANWLCLLGQTDAAWRVVV